SSMAALKKSLEEQRPLKYMGDEFYAAAEKLRNAKQSVTEDDIAKLLHTSEWQKKIRDQMAGKETDEEQLKVEQVMHDEARMELERRRSAAVDLAISILISADTVREHPRHIGNADGNPSAEEYAAYKASLLEEVESVSDPRNISQDMVARRVLYEDALRLIDEVVFPSSR